MVKNLPYFTLKTPPKTTALLKQAFADFIVKEDLGYEMSGEGEFVAVKIRKTDCNTLFVGEKLAKFAGISDRNMGYAGLKDRHGIIEQWFCLQMPGKETPDFSQFQLEGVEILDVTRHNRKIRTGSLQGNAFEILLRGAKESDELNERLNFVAKYGFPNYFTEQRFGHEPVRIVHPATLVRIGYRTVGHCYGVQLAVFQICPFALCIIDCRPCRLRRRCRRLSNLVAKPAARHRPFLRRTLDLPPARLAFVRLV